MVTESNAAAGAVENKSQALAPVPPADAGDQALAVTLYSKKGKELGKRISFCDKPAKEIRERLKKANPAWSANRLTKEVGACPTGKKDARWMLYEASVSTLRSAGGVPDYLDIKTKGATARFVIPEAAPVPVVETPEQKLEREEFELWRAEKARKAGTKSALVVDVTPV